MDLKQQNKLIERKNLSYQAMFYSIQRIDLLIIAISGGGIYVCLETIKFLSEKDLELNCLIKISGFFFLASIITNILAQVFGQLSNEQDYLMCESKLDEDPPELINKYDSMSELYSKITKTLNHISIFILFTGLVLIMTYFSFIF